MASSLRLHRNLALASAASFLVGASSVHCGSSGSTAGNSNSTTGTFNTGGNGSGTGTATGGSSGTFSGPSGSGGNITFDVQTKDYSAEDFFNADPPPMICGDSGVTPPVVTGTPECPSDKNLVGCPCQTGGQTAACWTGFRKFRDHGNCHDGMTSCVPTGETQQLGWGPCMGETLPVGTVGKAACECFSKGLWKIDNLSPCFVTDQAMTTVSEGISTNLTGQCPSDFTMAPADWSTNTLTVDCAGTFTLCYTIKAGDGKNPKPTDCVVGKSCVTAAYSMVNQPQALAQLPGWITDSSMTACAQKFYDTGGYGEMSVDGESNECEMVKKVFQHITYCPLACNTNPSGPGCVGCSNGAGGTF